MCLNVLQYAVSAFKGFVCRRFWLILIENIPQITSTYIEATTTFSLKVVLEIESSSPQTLCWSLSCRAHLRSVFTSHTIPTIPLSHHSTIPSSHRPHYPTLPQSPPSQQSDWQTSSQNGFDSLITNPDPFSFWSSEKLNTNTMKVCKIKSPYSKNMDPLTTSNCKFMKTPLLFTNSQSFDLQDKQDFVDIKAGDLLRAPDRFR